MIFLQSELIRVLSSALTFADVGKAADYRLNMVHLEADGQELTAVGTDRYVLGVDRTESLSGEGNWKFNISAQDVKALVATLKASDDVDAELFLKDEGEGVLKLSVRYASGEATFGNANDGDFPRWASLIPDANDKTATEAIAVDPALLAKFAKVAPGKNATMKMYFFGSGKPIRIEFIDSGFVGIIMPKRAEF